MSNILRGTEIVGGVGYGFGGGFGGIASIVIIGLNTLFGRNGFSDGFGQGFGCCENDITSCRHCLRTL